MSWTALLALGSWHPLTEVPIKFHIDPDASLLVTALAASVLAGLLFGLVPLRQIFRTDPNDAIKTSSQSSGARRWALRDFLLAAQIALCCITVTAAFVALRGLGKAMTMDLGFNPKQAVLTRFDLSQAGYSSITADRFQRHLLETVSVLPGIEAAGYANSTPLNGDQWSSPVFSEQATDFRPFKQAFDTYHYQVSPGYLAASATPLLAGRDVSFSDTVKTPLVAIVNQEFARRLFQSDHVVGRFFKNSSGASTQIIGVMVDGKHQALTEQPKAAALFPVAGTHNQNGAHRPLPPRQRRDGRDASQSDPRSRPRHSHSRL